MTRLILAITALLITLGGCDFERVVHYEIDSNSKTVTLWHEAESGAACRIHLDSEVVGPIELPEGDKWVFQYEGQPDSVYGLCD